MSKEDSTTPSKPAPPEAGCQTGGSCTESFDAAPIIPFLDDIGVDRIHRIDAGRSDRDRPFHVSERPFRTASNLQSRIPQ